MIAAFLRSHFAARGLGLGPGAWKARIVPAVHHHDRQWLGTTILGQILAVHARAAGGDGVGGPPRLGYRWNSCSDSLR